MTVLGRVLGTRAPFVPPGDIADFVGERKPLVLDVRTAEEVGKTGTYPGAVHIHLGELSERIDEVPGDRPILTA